jgi:hypothetical protein
VAKVARSLAAGIVAVLCLSGALFAQSPAVADTSALDELKALVFVLQTRLAAVEKELGQEKARRADLELSELQRARETLDPAVKKKLGLQVPDAPKTEQKPAPQPPK